MLTTRGIAVDAAIGIYGGKSFGSKNVNNVDSVNNNAYLFAFNNAEERYNDYLSEFNTSDNKSRTLIINTASETSVLENLNTQVSSKYKEVVQLYNLENAKSNTALEKDGIATDKTSIGKVNTFAIGSTKLDVKSLSGSMEPASISIDKLPENSNYYAKKNEEELPKFLKSLSENINLFKNNENKGFSNANGAENKTVTNNQITEAQNEYQKEQVKEEVKEKAKTIKHVTNDDNKPKLQQAQAELESLQKQQAQQIDKVNNLDKQKTETVSLKDKFQVQMLSSKKEVDNSESLLAKIDRKGNLNDNAKGNFLDFSA